jgi:NadR type nicotinamide-nucleotide adenylyltransferase
MKGTTHQVVVTGSECTGKTTLTAELAATYRAPWSAEYVREYVDGKATALTAADVEAIALGQVAVEDAATRSAQGLVLHDTDLVSTMVYARHYYGSCPSWIEQAAHQRRAHLYLLLHPDVPWIADGLQRDRPFERNHLHRLFRLALRDLGTCLVDVLGPWDARRATAHRAIEDLLHLAAD